MIRAAAACKTDDEGHALLQTLLDIFIAVAAFFGIFSINAGHLFGSFLGGAQCRDFLLAEEAGISQSPAHQILDENLIDGATSALIIRTVVPRFPVLAGALIEMDAEILQGIDDGVNGAFYIALVVGIFDAQIEEAAALMGQPFINKGTIQVAEMDETRGTWAKACDPGTLGKHSLGEGRFNIGRGFGDRREQKFRQFIVIHR